jgi:NAD-dependent dihydropyrimidine dehydrogenase PreA subunit
MSYVIAKPCIGVKDTACVVICPVDCIHPKPDDPKFATAEQLFIDPGVCIDCGACMTECPVAAIFHEEDVPGEWQGFIAKNAAYFQSK